MKMVDPVRATCVATPRAALRERLVPQLRDTVLFWVTTQLDPTIAATEDALFERAVNAAGAEAQNRLFAAMQELRAGRSWLVVGIQHELCTRIERALTGSTSPQAAGLSESDTSSRHRELVTAALDRHEATLLALNRLLDGLLGNRRFDGAAHCIAGPELLCASLVQACAGIRVSPEASSALLEEFARGSLARLDELGVQCAGLLVDAGVVPAAQHTGSLAVDARVADAERALRAHLAATGAEPVRRLVRLVFKAVAADGRFVPRLRKALCALEGRVLEAALGDPGFFSEARHPLRHAIADIGALGIGICEADAAGEDGQLLEIERFADALAGHGNEPAQITGLLEEFGSWCAGELHRARLQQRRVEDAEQARVLASTARAAIERVIARELGAQRLPGAAEEMLREGFHRVLMHAWLCGGTEGADWQTALGCLGSFMTLWRHGAARLPEALADRLRDAMTHAGCDPLRTEILLRSIEEELASWDPPSPVDYPALVHVVEVPAVEPAGAARARLEEVAELQRHAWFVFAPGAAAAARAQLALRCGEPQRLLFVGRYGQRAGTFTAEELALLLASGRARVLDASDPLDFALRTLHVREQGRHEHAA